MQSLAFVSWFFSQEQDYRHKYTPCMSQDIILLYICLQGLTWMQFHVIWMPFMRQGLFWNRLKSSSTAASATGAGHSEVVSTGPN